MGQQQGRGGRELPRPNGVHGQRRPPVVAWFAGADLRLLALTPSEWSFYSALGSAVLLLACGSGFAMSIAIGYMLQVPASHVWFLGLAWTIVLAGGIERLVLQVASARKWLLALALIPRVVLSLMLAVQFGEPLMMRINQGEINNQLSKTHTAAVHGAISRAKGEYQPKIDADNKQIAAIQAREQNLKTEIEHYRFLSSCEADTPTCSTTGKLGCGTYCQHYARTGDELQAELSTLKPQDKTTIVALRADIATNKHAMKTEIQSRKTAIGDNSGLLARERALSELEKTDPAVAAEVWFWRLFFLPLDLLPLAAKVFKLLTSVSPYEDLVEAQRRRDKLGATQTNAAVRVEERRIRDQAQADIEVNTVSINLDKARRIDEAEGVIWGTPSGTGPSRPAGERQTVSAWNLNDFVDQIAPHERQHVPMPPGLRRGGLIGLALVAALAIVSLVWTIVMHHTLNGLWLPIVAFALVGGLAAYTRGFKTAPHWALRATLATLFLGLLLPVAVLGFNL